MSFLDQYLKGDTLPPVDPAIKDRLSALETDMTAIIVKAGGTFDDCLKQYGPHMADLVQRVSQGLKRPTSIKESLGVFRLIYSIAIEVHQMVTAMQSCVVQPGMTPEQQDAAKLKFGQDLVYFIWSTINPLSQVLNWIPLKAVIEKELVMWLAGIALQSVVDLFRSPHLAVAGSAKTISFGSHVMSRSPVVIKAI